MVSWFLLLIMTESPASRSFLDACRHSSLLEDLGMRDSEVAEGGQALCLHSGGGEGWGECLWVVSSTSPTERAAFDAFQILPAQPVQGLRDPAWI